MLLTDSTWISSLSGSIVALCVNPAAGTINRRKKYIKKYKKKLSNSIISGVHVFTLVV